MLFKSNMIEAIAAGKKTQTRRMVKEGDMAIVHVDPKRKTPGDGMLGVMGKILTTGELPKGASLAEVRTPGRNIRWKVGHKYLVQPSRGKKGMWWCSGCKRVKENDGTYKFPDTLPICECKLPMFPLKIRMKSIAREGLIEVCGDCAKEEGFESREQFLKEFRWIHRSKLPKHQHPFYHLESWNPEVWVLDFEVV